MRPRLCQERHWQDSLSPYSSAFSHLSARTRWTRRMRAARILPQRIRACYVICAICHIARKSQGSGELPLSTFCRAFLRLHWIHTDKAFADTTAYASMPFTTANSKIFWPRSGSVVPSCDTMPNLKIPRQRG